MSSNKQIVFIIIVLNVFNIFCDVLNTSQKKALIFGVNGQDGSYLSRLLLEKGYEVHGVVRRATTLKLDTINEIIPHIVLHFGDVNDLSNVVHLITTIRPDEVYNLAAQSHVKISFELPEYTATTDALGVLHILEAIRLTNLEKVTRFYQASTSEMFGRVQAIPQSETTPFYPVSPYGAAKLYAHWITKIYRESYGMFACSGILFNHESPYRGELFVTRKITLGIAAILRGEQQYIAIGNLDSLRDWGYAKEYVEAMWLMLQQDVADDYVIATGEMHTVREFMEEAFALVGIHIIWKGRGIDEIGIDKATGKVLVKVDPAYFRPLEVDLLIGDASKAATTLGWKPRVKFEELVKIMVEADLKS